MAGDEALAGTPVRLAYTTTVDDVRLGLVARAKAARQLSPARGRSLVLVIAAAVVLAFLFFLLTDIDLDLGVGPVVFLFAMVFVAAGIARWQQQRSHRELAEQLGQVSVTLDAEGVRLESPHRWSTNEWPAYAHYVETPEYFVLLSPGRTAMIVTTLPKRGLADPIDVERLRTLLDAHVTAL